MNYLKSVSRKPPEGLLSFAADELDTAGLVYEIEWVKDCSLDAVLTDNVKKIKAVRCTCSECGQSVILSYAPPNHTWSPGKDTYGFYHPEDGEGVWNGGSTLCPVCGNPVSVRCAAQVGRWEFTASETNVMAASLLPGEPGECPLVLTGWNIRRLVNRYGVERYDIRPLEAYVFEKESAYKLSGWVKSYSGTVGYFMAVNREWRQPQRWSETWGQEERIFGLTAELVEESCLGNSKFDLYMKPHWLEKTRSPVTYLRLYQRYPQIENLVMQGCGYLLDRMFTEKMSVSEWENNREGVVELPELHVEEKRPAQMLGLTKEEFSVMKAQSWDLYHWRVFTKAKAVGDCMRLPGDITLLHEYGAEDIEQIIGKAPVGKTLRYLLRAIREWSAANDPYNEYVEYMPDDDLINATFLADYWNMAEIAGWSLDNPAIRWPKNLLAAHDRAMAASEVVQTKSLASKFRERTKELKKFEYASGALLIRPAISQKDLTREGKLLVHCVAGYGKDIALGQTAIFFIRHAWEPREPYFTLEYNEKRETVAQNRGYDNHARTPEVKAFEDEWLAWVRKGCKRKKDGTPIGAKPVITENPNKKKEAIVA